MGATAAVGFGVFQATTQIMGGMQASKEAEWNASMAQQEASYNASIFRQQAGMVEQQKQLKAMQDSRKIRFMEGKITAMTAAKGLEMSGSPMAVLNDTMTQMEMDKAITSYNYDMDKYYLESQARATEYKGQSLANMYRRQGSSAMLKGLVGGLTTLAGTGMYAAQRYGGTPTKSINTSGGQTYSSMMYSQGMFGSTTRNFGGSPLTI